MKSITSPKILFAAFILGLPVISYLFLDQISLRRAEDYADKWYARESHQLEDPQKVIARYEDEIHAASDIKDMGLAKAATGSAPGVAVSKRIGFLEYKTTIALPGNQQTAVFFIFSDDSSVLDFIWLLSAMGIVVIVAVWMRIKVDQERTKLLEDNTILAMQSFAHDFRAPFSKVRVLLKLLQDNSEAKETELKNFKSDLEGALQQADGMLIDFLNFGRPDANKEVIDVEQLLKGLESSYFKSRANDLNLHFALDFETSAKAAGSSQRTLRVLMNLIDNAFKHAASRVTVRVKDVRTHLAIIVENDGPGIEKKNISRIFEPFFSARKGGVGLGLFISLNFAKAQGGTISCTSDANRTVFSFTLPLATKAPVETMKATAKQEEERLVVPIVAFIDDEAFYRKIVSDTLSKDGVKVDCFASTDELLMALRDPAYKPSLILSDRFGPRFDAVLDRFAESCRDYGYLGPIVLYSSSVSGSEKHNQIFRVVDKGTVISGEDINRLIREYKNET